MTKTELMEKVVSELQANDEKVTKASVKRTVDAVFDTIVEEVVDGNEVRIIGFGTFKPVKRAARKGVNPATGKKMTIPATTAVKFSVGKTFKDKVAGK